MIFLKNILKFIFIILLVGLIPLTIILFYPYIFSKTIVGQITAVERVNMPLTLLTSPNNTPPSQIFSFAVGIKEEVSGEIFTASSEDRQWAAAEKGLCVKAKFFPYPPWKLDKSGTYYGARLLRLYDCHSKPKDE
jgi:hypothetical protein